jgi:WD40 repeat protein
MMGPARTLAAWLVAVALMTAAQAGKPRSNLTAKVRAPLEGHQGYIHALACSPDGRTLASGDTSGTVKLWDVGTGKERASWQAHRGNAMSLSFAPDGKLLATGGLDQKVKLWDMATMKEWAVLQHSGFAVSAVAFSPDGKSLAAGATHGSTGQVAPAYEVLVWDVATKKLRTTLPGHEHGINGLAFSLDGRSLAVSSGDGSLRLWDLVTARERKRWPMAGGAVVLSPDGRRLLAVKGVGTRLSVVEIASGRPAGTWQAGLVVRRLAMSPDGRWLAAVGYDALPSKGDRHMLRLWDRATAKKLATLEGAESYLFAVTFAGDGRTVAAAGHDRKIWLWDLHERPAPWPAR